MPAATVNARRCRARIHGFTIAEVSLAVIVLAMGIATSITAMQRAYSSLDTARNLTLAGSIMQTEIEKERLLNWTQVSDGTYQPAIDPAILRNASVAGRFTLLRTVTPVANRSGQMVQVTLSVTWRGYDGRSLSRSYTTYFLQSGLYNYIYQSV